MWRINNNRFVDLNRLEFNTAFIRPIDEESQKIIFSFPWYARNA